MEPEKFESENILKELFFAESDLINVETGEKAMSLERFIGMSMEKGLFSEKSTLTFSQAYVLNDYIGNFEELIVNWRKKMAELKKR